MTFSARVQQALTIYDQETGFFKKLFNEHPAIKAMKRLSNEDQGDNLKVLRCFFDNMPERSQAPYKIYEAALRCVGFSEFFLQTLHSHNILTLENILAINQQEYPYLFIIFTVSLHAHKIFTQENLDALLSTNDTASMESMLMTLHRANILNQKNRNVLINLAQLPKINLAQLPRLTLGDFSRVINAINESNLLTQANFDALSAANNCELVSITGNIWNRLPAHLLTQTVFDQLVIYAQQVEPQRHIAEYIDRLLGIQNNNLINGSQSTHTASVHASTDLSAWLLYTAYQNKPIENNFDGVLSQLNQALKSTPNSGNSTASIESFDHDDTAQRLIVAKKCLNRLESVDIQIELSPEKKQKSLRFIKEVILKNEDNQQIKKLLPELEKDKNNSTIISLNSFIHWVFIAAMVKNKTTDDQYKNANMKAFVDALYEIERGYNLNEIGKDDQQIDHAICYGGTANKFCERLQSSSELIQFIFVTKETITRKINRVFLATLLEHCQHLLKKANTGGVEDKITFCNLVNQLMDKDKACDVYNHIFDKDSISKNLEEEFNILLILNENAQPLFFINEYIEHSLPYLPAINLTKINNFYTVEFLNKFKLFVNAKTNFELEDAQKRKQNPSGVTECGLFANSATIELNLLPDEETFKNN